MKLKLSLPLPRNRLLHHPGFCGRHRDAAPDGEDGITPLSRPQLEENQVSETAKDEDEIGRAELPKLILRPCIGLTNILFKFYTV